MLPVWFCQVTEDVKAAESSEKEVETAVPDPVSPSMDVSLNSARDDSSIYTPRKGRRRQVICNKMYSLHTVRLHFSNIPEVTF